MGRKTIFGVFRNACSFFVVVALLVANGAVLDAVRWAPTLTSGGTATLQADGARLAVSTVGSALGTFTIPGVGSRKVRLQAQGVNVRVKVWQANQVEPVVWTKQVTTTSVAGAGRPAVSLVRTAGSNQVTVDDWSFTNPTVAPATIAGYAYNTDSQITLEALNAGSRGWVYVNGRVSSYTQTIAGATTATALTYDSAGRLASETTGALTKSYVYDPADQLKLVTPSTGSATAYNYDALGRRTSVVVGTATTANTYNAASELTKVGTKTFTYDAGGRRLSETAGTVVTGYGYDAQGRQTVTTRGAVTSTRGYDADDNLVSVSDGVTATGIDWDPTKGVAQPTIVGAQRYVFGPDGWLQTRTGIVDTNVGRDVYGSVITPSVLARSTGYDAFGKPNAGANTFVPKLGYRGEITIDSLTYLRARNYDAANGVFTSRDPVDGMNGTPTVGYAFQYGDNSPFANSDPTGQSTMGTEYGTVSDAWANTNSTYGGQVRETDGKWVAQAVFWGQQLQQSRSEMDQAFKEADRLSNVSVGEYLAIQGLSVAAGAACGAGAAYLTGGNVYAAGAAGNVCYGVVDRFVTGLASGDGMNTSLTSAFDIRSVAVDAATGAALAGAAKVLSGPATSLKNALTSKLPILNKEISFGAKQLATNTADDIAASTPTGSKGNNLNVATPEGMTASNAPGSAGGRAYSGHAFDRMQGQGITPSAVENTITPANAVAGKVPGTTAYYDPVNNLTVITDSGSGRVVTVDYGKIRQ